MPMYDYECKCCGNIVETFHTMHTKPYVECETCGSSMDKVILSPPMGHVECKTLGMLAQRNAERMSEDEKHSITKPKEHDVKKIKRRLHE
jgi:putative FmdB family regulatory protein